MVDNISNMNNYQGMKCLDKNVIMNAGSSYFEHVENYCGSNDLWEPKASCRCAGDLKTS